MKTYYLITKNDENDYELWVTNNMDDDTTGWSTRGTLEDIRQELADLDDIKSIITKSQEIK